ncbi:hypothetical protein ACC862_37585, partial [Rhizobium ruizarguesonis]
ATAAARFALSSGRRLAAAACRCLGHLSDSREAGIIAAQSFPKGWRGDRIMPGSPIFPSNDMKTPRCIGGAKAAAKTHEEKKLNKF